MHNEAMAFVRQFATDKPISVIEIGSRDINGSVRMLFPHAHYTGIDLYEGPGVDVVCNAMEWEPDDVVDMVISCECFEHTDQWKEIISRAANWLNFGGRMIITAAGPGRAPHSHHDGGPLRDGEYYGNILPVDMRDAMTSALLLPVICTTLGDDVQAAGLTLYGMIPHRML